MKTIIGFMVWVMIVIAAIFMTVVSIVALTCGAVIYGAAYCILYVIGAVSVLVVSVYMWWYSLLLKMMHLNHD